MKYNLTEQKVLKKLNIPDFRHMTKDKISKFMAMTPNMDPTVVKAAIEQFPNFKDFAVEMTDSLKELVEISFNANKESQKFFYDSCNKVLSTLEKDLEKENISEQERDNIRNKMMEVILCIGAKDSENKKFTYSIIRDAFLMLGLVTLGAVSVLGTAILTPTSEESIYDENEEDYF